MCVLYLLCLFPLIFTSNLPSNYSALFFSPGLSAPHYVLPLLAPDSFQQVLKGNCNSFTLKNMCNYITERKGWSWKRGSSCSCREPKFYPPPQTHTCESSDSQLSITQFQGMPGGMHVVYICEYKQKIHTHNVELIFKITDIKGFD